jgi:hypothetical protein
MPDRDASLRAGELAIVRYRTRGDSCRLDVDLPR